MIETTLFLKIIGSTWNIYGRLKNNFYALIMLFFSLSLSLSLISCKKTDPTPEVSDLIYQDMESQEADAQRILGDVSKKLEEARLAVENSKPQTGQLRRAQKSYFDIKNTVAKLEQQLLYWRARKLERKKFVRLSIVKYETDEWQKKMKSEFAVYQSEKKLRQAKNSWDVKQRFNELGIEYDPLLLGEEKKAPQKKEAPKSGH